MNPTEMHRVCERLIVYLETGEAATDLFTEDVLAIRRRGHPTPGKVPRWTAQPTPEGFVMELEERWSDAKGDWYCREAIVARVREGMIDRLAVYCTGDWDQPRQEAHAAQVSLLEA
jgi:hypothetical protein